MRVSGCFDYYSVFCVKLIISSHAISNKESLINWPLTPGPFPRWGKGSGFARYHD